MRSSVDFWYLRISLWHTQGVSRGAPSPAPSFEGGARQSFDCRRRRRGRARSRRRREVRIGRGLTEGRLFRVCICAASSRLQRPERTFVPPLSRVASSAPCRRSTYERSASYVPYLTPNTKLETLETRIRERSKWKRQNALDGLDATLRDATGADVTSPINPITTLSPLTTLTSRNLESFKRRLSLGYFVLTESRFGRSKFGAAILIEGAI